MACEPPDQSRPAAAAKRLQAALGKTVPVPVKELGSRMSRNDC